MHTKVLSGSGYSDKNPTPSQCPVFYCLSQQGSCALPTYVQRMAGVESRAKCSVGNEWWKINLFFLMIIHSLECLGLAACLLIGILWECPPGVLYSVGWDRAGWDGVGWDMMGWMLEWSFSSGSAGCCLSCSLWWQLLSIAYRCERATCDVQLDVLW